MVVLIVDDNSAMRRVIRAVVWQLALDADIAECDDGAQAIEFCHKRRPDWVLMDIRLGGMNGIEASRQIKAQYPDIRIVIVTNYDDAGLREAAVSAGACAYLLKENLMDLRQIFTT